jgi:tetratricopeptide (TPR) repeat protein
VSTSSDSFPFASIPLQAGRIPIGSSKSDRLEYLRRCQEVKRTDRLVQSLLTPEQAERMAEVARTCLARGDLQRGIQAIALAVAVDPGRADWRQTLDHYMDAVVRDEGALLPDLASPWFLFNPLRAYLAMRRGRLSEELIYITGVVSSYPQRQYLEHWVLPWLDTRSMRELGAPGLHGLFATLLRRYPEADQLTEQQKKYLQSALRQMRRAERLLGFDEKLLVLRLMALGKLGRFAMVVREAKAAHEAHPGWHTAVAVANALRRSGRPLEAVPYFRLASRYDAQDVSALLEIGDIYLIAGQWKPAINAYQRALRRRPHHSWAVPSIAYCRYRVTGDGKFLTRLRRLARSRGDSCGAANFLAALKGDHGPGSRSRRAQQLLAVLNAERISASHVGRGLASRGGSVSASRPGRTTRTFRKRRRDKDGGEFRCAWGRCDRGLRQMVRGVAKRLFQHRRFSSI